MELYKLTIHEAQDLMKKGEITSKEITYSCLARLESVEDEVQAFNAICNEEALIKAQNIDEQRAKGEILPDLAGIPMALKDNICTMNIHTTCSSKMLSNFLPPYNATVVEILDKQGAVLLGKTNMDEFAMGTTTESSVFKSTRNPWDFTKVPGGSSGGSAACVSSDQVFYALGSDTGGSIRQPASLCGVVGLKPTYGTVSRYGLIAFASSLDQIGPLTKDVRDCALVMNAILQYDEKDSTSVNMEHPDYTESLIDNVKNMRIGIPKEYFSQGLDNQVQAAVEKAIHEYENLGAICGEITLPSTKYTLPVYELISSAEAASNLARFDGVRYGYRTNHSADIDELYRYSRSQGFGQEVKRRIILGNLMLTTDFYDTYYEKALKLRTLIKNEFDQAFQEWDLIISPTCPVTAINLGEKAVSLLKTDLSDVYTAPASLAGLPAISIPCGFDDSGLPMGLQLIGKAFDEATLLRAAYTFEQNTDYHIKKPSMNRR